MIISIVGIIVTIFTFPYWFRSILFAMSCLESLKSHRIESQRNNQENSHEEVVNPKV